ncbi:Gfo/Idh/MocA family protein [Nonomuraea sp. 3N208]|uniref:Gfo/Idh/MocA family protein n=1 Tax=Nonomuraea sp. 3N208 TaxID=3457421 RepID=UPI003FD4A5C9
MKPDVTVGIIGYGLIGRIHAEAVSKVDGAILAGIVSSGEDVPPGVHRCATDEELYAEVAPDVVAICTPPTLHARQTQSALEHGAHVLVEKPPAITVAELRDLQKLAESADRRFAVVSQQRLLPHLAHVAEIVHSGRLGRPLLGEVRLHWHRPQSYYEIAAWRATDPLGGSLPNQGWHAVDLLTWYLGPATWVTGQIGTLAHVAEVEDTAVATVRFSGGALGSIVTTTTTPPGHPTEISLFFERGTVRIHDTEIVTWPDEIPLPGRGRVSSGAADPAAIGADGHRRQWQDLIDAVRTGGRPAVTAAESIHTLALIEAVYTSARTGRAVALERA